MSKILEVYNYNDTQIKDLIQSNFQNEHWAEVFVNDSHHGFVHGNQVRLSCLKLIETLTDREKKEFQKEWKEISNKNPYESAIVASEIAAVFHDCGRFNGEWLVIADEQKYHHILSANRAKIFCEKMGLEALFPFVEEAILCHDFQSKELTPDLNNPKTIIGKLVQSSDQMWWFHPDSIYRTLEYNKALGKPLFDPTSDFQERINWKPWTSAKDAVTVMLKQLFGPTWLDRFWIEYARTKIESYKIWLEENILKLAEQNRIYIEIKELIVEFKSQLETTWNTNQI